MDPSDGYYRIQNEALVMLLEYRLPSEIHHMDENRAGFPLYDGNLYEYREWVYKLEMRVYAIGEAEEEAGNRRKLAAGMTNALRGRAAKLAWDIGAEKMRSDGFQGFDLLRHRLEEYHTHP